MPYKRPVVAAVTAIFGLCIPLLAQAGVDDWKSFTPQGANFTVVAPGDLVRCGFDALLPSENVFVLQTSSAIYAVGYLDLPHRDISKMGNTPLLRISGFQDFVVKSLNAKETTNRLVQVKNSPGRETCFHI